MNTLESRVTKIEAVLEDMSMALRMFVGDMEYDIDEPEVPLEREEGEDG